MKTCNCNNSRCQHRPFVQLHLHSDASILDGAGKIDNYLKLAKEFNHPAMAITDHGNMSRTFQFYQKAKQSGIKPILGMEAYLNDNQQDNRDEKKYEGSDTHQSILIKNKQGFINLNKLTYLGFTSGYYRRPRITTEWLIANKEGLLITTSCMASKLARLVQEGKETEAEERVRLLIKEFGEDIVAEIQLNEVEQQKKYNEFIVKMIRKYNLMPILAGDVHYAKKDDARLQDVLIAINQKKSIYDHDAFKLEARHLYYHNFDDYHRMNKEFGFNYKESFIDRCLENTLKVAEKCNFEFETDIEKYPKYQPTKDVIDYFKSNSTKEIITELSHAKLNQKIKIYQQTNTVKITTEKEKEYYDRLDYELKVIDDKKMLDYFMVLWEIVKFCQKENIKIGPGRGSVGGSLLAWTIDITEIDPIRFNLYFERFLNPERKSVPDIDIDFEAGTDEKTLKFLYDKYGEERVIPVVTFGTFNEKGCLKDVARALGQDSGFQSDVFAVTKEMPDKPTWDISLEEWLTTWPADKNCSERVRKWILDPENQETIQLTLKFQGMIRGIGKHAAGITILPDKVWEYMPINISKGQIVSGFQESGSGKDLSSLGILKLDRLKLETLNVIKEATKLVKENKNIDIEDKIKNIDIEDKNLYREILSGNNQGVFQFESDGMNTLLKGIQVEKFDELVAANSLYRPGPMGVEAHTDYIKNKFKPEETKYVHSSLEPLLKNTNGVLIYQEQLMFIANKIGKMTLGEGDNLRKYMDSASKIIAKNLRGETLTEDEINNKNYKGYLELWIKFIQGAKDSGISERDVKKIEEWLIKYLGYSFNLSHATAYSYLAMRTLFLKHYYPTEFYTALLNHPKSNGDKEKEKQWLTSAMLSAMSKGIEILPPHRKSNWEWTVLEDKKIAMGYSAINGLGEKAFAELKEKGLGAMSKDDFFTTKFSKFNKTSFESCLKAGLFDDWSNSREELIELRKIKIKDVKQLDIFGNVGISTVQLTKKFPTTTQEQKHKEFIEVCSLDLQLIEKISNLKKMFIDEYQVNIESALNFENPKNYYYFILHSVEQKTTARNKKYYALTISDGAMTKKVNMWEEVYKKNSVILEVGGFYVTKFYKEKGWLSFDATSEFRRVF